MPIELLDQLHQVYGRLNVHVRRRGWPHTCPIEHAGRGAQTDGAIGSRPDHLTVPSQLLFLGLDRLGESLDRGGLELAKPFQSGPLASAGA
jgi:hypothetical protein